MDSKIEAYIDKASNEALQNTNKKLKKWFLQHQISPRKVQLALDVEGKEEHSFFLITDHNGVHDGSYRIVFDPENHNFGLACTLKNGVEWYMGSYGSLLQTLKSI